MNLFNPNMNTNNSYLADEERKEHKATQSRTHHNNNKEQIATQHKNWREKNGEYKKEFDKKIP